MSHESESPSPESGQALSVLRDIWSAQSRSAEELESLLGPAKPCKAMRHIGNEPVDEGLRESWRERLAREGKLRPDGESVRDLVFGSAERPR